ncbi:MAG: hypothetical protein JWN00_2672, partial [Actinomycetia bacterium]|nr:hypothetical protein [Actinomycetes bacterium]
PRRPISGELMLIVGVGQYPHPTLPNR